MYEILHIEPLTPVTKLHEARQAMTLWEEVDR